MSQFIRILGEEKKSVVLASACKAVRDGESSIYSYDVNPESFEAVPGSPFAYWVSGGVRDAYVRLPAFENDARIVKQGLATAEDFRFVRLWWEAGFFGKKWSPFAKGGVFSPFYASINLLVNWSLSGAEIKAGICHRYPYLNGNPDYVAKHTDYYHRPGLTWPRRTTSGLSIRVMPSGCVFADKGPAAFVVNDDGKHLLALLAMSNSKPFGLLVALQLAAADAAARSYEVGVIQKAPVPEINEKKQSRLSELARRAWSLKRSLDTVTETSHAFILPAALQDRLGDYDPPAVLAELADIQAAIDDISFDLYGFSEEDRRVAQGDVGVAEDIEEGSDNENQIEEAPPLDALLSWAAGVAFGRFDWRLATGEREVPPEPEPFDPLPAKSPGMLPDGVEPYHRHAGILVDDPGHKHDLPRLMADVLETVDAPVDEDLRRWLRRDFFKYHLQQYSKSRRKAPIYWPLATASGSYTLWLYYPDLTDQTLFTAVNDFVEPKLKQVDSELGNLRLAGTSRSRADEKRLEELSDFRDELADLRDTLLRIAPGYKPNHDDGVQITAAPLWPLFRHRPWQNVLRDTWEKLEQGDYDWAHLAMAYWPERVREKCVTDKSLAIAHDLEHLYVEPEPAPKKARGRKKSAGSGE